MEISKAISTAPPTTAPLKHAKVCADQKRMAHSDTTKQHENYIEKLKSVTKY